MYETVNPIIKALQETMSSRQRQDTIAIVHHSDRFTYKEIDCASDAVAAALMENGIPGRTVIPVFGDQSPEYISIVLGILKHGSIFFPMGTRMPVTRVRELLAIVQPEVVFFTRKPQNSPEQPNDFLGNYLQLHLSDIRRASVECSHHASTSKRTPSPVSLAENPDACYIIPTSGSTGVPKLILGSAQGVLHFVNWELRTFNIDDQVHISALSAPTFDVSLRDMFAALLSGSTVCIPDRSSLIDPAALFAWFREMRIGITHIVPSVFRLLLREVEMHRSTMSLPDLRVLLLAGEPLYFDDIARWRAISCDAPTFVNLYGPSETTLAKLFHVVAEETAAPAHSVVPLGRPIDDTEVVILDNNNISCATGVTGEIFISTAYRSHGYFHNSNLTKERFIHLSLGGGTGKVYYRTGDMGFRDDAGLIHFQGREDGQIKISGNRVEVGEIEIRLRTHPAIAEAVVIPFGSIDIRLAAYVLMRPGTSVTVEKIRSFLGSILPDYMIPSVIQCVDTFPRTHSGKIDRRALPPPVRGRPALPYEYIGPATTTEQRLATLWQELLFIDEIGIHDNFFDIGGTSLLAAHLILKINEFHSPALSVTKLFEHPTIGMLSQFLDKEKMYTPPEDDMEAHERGLKRRMALRRRIPPGQPDHS